MLLLGSDSGFFIFIIILKIYLIKGVITHSFFDLILFKFYCMVPVQEVLKSGKQQIIHAEPI